MLIDVPFQKPDERQATILAMLGGGSFIPERISEGMYLATHWNVDNLVPTRERWREKPMTFLDFDEYGVCDTPEQAVERLKLRERPEKFFVSFVRIRRADQPSDGGWRWHKWGEYIGDREPQHEYLYHEPDIEEVYTFHVYEPAAVAQEA